MKKVNKIILLIVFSISIFSCRAQMVQTPADAKKLELNKEQFIGKPLMFLLKQIKPNIGRAVISYNEDGNNMSFFSFSFSNRKDYNKFKNEGKTPLTIRVSVEGAIDVDYTRRSRGYPWTIEDEKKYGDYKIINIHVYGDAE